MSTSLAEQPGLEHAKIATPLPEVVKYEEYQPELKPYYEQPDPHPSPARERRICGFRPATFILATALAIILALGVIGTGVAGSLAVKRQHTIGRRDHEIEKLRRQLFIAPTPTSSADSSSSTTSSNNTRVGPTSVIRTGCSSLKSPWVSEQPALGNSVFQLYCGTDYPGNDILGIFADSLENCLMACASYNNRASRTHPNSHCGVVSFDERAMSEANCWVKETNNDAALKSSNVMSGRVISQVS